MTKLSIISMELIRRKLHAGYAVAKFTVDVGPVRIAHCAIIEHDDGTLAAFIPRSQHGGKLVKFREHDHYVEFTSAALAAYAGMISSNDPQDKTTAPARPRAIPSEWALAKGVGS